MGGSGAPLGPLICCRVQENRWEEAARTLAAADPGSRVFSTISMNACHSSCPSRRLQEQRPRALAHSCACLKVGRGTRFQPVGGPVEPGEVGGPRQQLRLQREHRRHARLVRCQALPKVEVPAHLLLGAGWALNAMLGCSRNYLHLAAMRQALPTSCSGMLERLRSLTWPRAFVQRRNTMVASMPRRTGSSRSASARSSGCAERSLPAGVHTPQIISSIISREKATSRQGAGFAVAGRRTECPWQISRPLIH